MLRPCSFMPDMASFQIVALAFLFLYQALSLKPSWKRGPLRLAYSWANATHYSPAVSSPETNLDSVSSNEQSSKSMTSNAPSITTDVSEDSFGSTTEDHSTQYFVSSQIPSDSQLDASPGFFETVSVSAAFRTTLIVQSIYVSPSLRTPITDNTIQKPSPSWTIAASSSLANPETETPSSSNSLAAGTQNSLSSKDRAYPLIEY
jgi:hypothetical protein